MFISIMKVITLAMLGGFFLFALPFLIFKAIIFFLFFGLIIRLISGRRRFRRWHRYHGGFYGYPNYGYDTPQREFLTDPSERMPQKV
jgi:hypothetical protein